MRFSDISTTHLSLPARQRLEPLRAILVVIDIQEKLMPPIWEGKRLLRNVRLLLELCGILSIPVLATTQYARGLGETVPTIRELLPASTTVYDKVEFSCFGCDDFDAALGRAKERDQLLLCGMETHICIMQTALSALERNFDVHVAADAVGSRSELNWRLGLERMASAGAVISSTEMAIYELLRGSGGEAFRRMLPFLKQAD